MAETASDDLFDLIHSLNKNEKRRFRLEAQKSRGRTQQL